MKKNKNTKKNIIKILLSKNRVNNYTKLLLYLNLLYIKNDYYIPNAKLQKVLKISKRQIITILHQLEEDKTIEIYFKNNKRYFKFNGIYTEQKNNHNDIFDYSWLEKSLECDLWP